MPRTDAGDDPKIAAEVMAAARAQWAVEMAGGSIADEMLNPMVQVYGDVAILTCSYAGATQTKDGKTKSAAGKSTRVYARQNSQWKLVNAHFSSVDSPKN